MFSEPFALLEALSFVISYARSYVSWALETVIAAILTPGDSMGNRALTASQNSAALSGPRPPRVGSSSVVGVRV